MVVEVYLDHAATSPARPEVVDLVAHLMREVVGNPTGAHAAARRARDVVEDARDRIAAVLGVTPGEVVLCSGGTEADALAIGGLSRTAGDAVCSAVEHAAVLEAVTAREGVVVPVDHSGAVDVDRLTEALGPATAVVSVMTVNNEVGVIQPIGEVARVVRERAPGAKVHTDAVQAAAWADLARLTAEADLVSISAHKFGGPQGVGCLVVRDGVTLAPCQRGGGQERGRRGGTHHVAGIAGMALALELTVASREAESMRLAALRDRLLDGLAAAIEGLVLPGAPARARGDLAPHIACVAVPGCASDELLYLLDRAGIAASAGSSCSSGAQQLPHTLAAMGVDPTATAGAVRFSLGHTTTEREVDRVLDVLPQVVAHLRDAERTPITGEVVRP